MSDIVFMDTETLGLHPDAPIWEFAAIRRGEPGGEPGAEREFHCFIDHYPLPWIDSLPDEFAQDYRNRYSPEKAVTQYEATKIIRDATAGAHVVGAVPNFDTERLQKMLLRAGGGGPFHAKEPWHYHLIDIENVVVGYLLGRDKDKRPTLRLPWKSDNLSEAIGVDPRKFERHTAMGDVLWTMAQWDAIGIDIEAVVA